MVISAIKTRNEQTKYSDNRKHKVWDYGNIQGRVNQENIHQSTYLDHS